MNIILVIIILILINFWLPPQASEKIILNGCTSVIICLFLLYFTQKIPAMGTHTPLIGNLKNYKIQSKFFVLVLFYSSCLYVVAFSTIASVIVIWLSRTKHSSTLPWVIKHPLTGTFGRFLGLSTYIQQVFSKKQIKIYIFKFVFSVIDHFTQSDSRRNARPSSNRF